MPKMSTTIYSRTTELIPPENETNEQETIKHAPDKQSNADNRDFEGTEDDISEADSVENIYATYEPDDTYGIDAASGIDLIPLSKELAKAEQDYSSFGLFQAFTREKVEQNVSNLKQKFLQSIAKTSFSTFLGGETEWIAKGSSMEGTLFPSIVEYDREKFLQVVLGENPTQHAEDMLCTFLDKVGPTKYLMQSADIDIMVAPKNFKLQTEMALLQTCHPTYYRICVNKTDMGAWDDCCQPYYAENTSHIILSPNKTKDIFYMCLKTMSDSCMDAEHAMIVVPHGLAFQVTELQLSQHALYAEMYDLAIAATCNFWLSIAQEWVKRKRIWPSESEVQACVDGGVHMVIKSPTQDPNNLLWRVSFAKAETTICRLPLVYWYALRSWSLGKSLLQTFNHENAPKLLTSYHVKTLFFYMLERLPKDYWINEENMLKTVLTLIDDLTACLCMQECVHYFLPAINLLQSKSNPLPVDMFSTVARSLRRERKTILQDPMEYFFPGTRGTGVSDESDS